MIPYGHQNIDEKDIAAVICVLRSDFLTQGPEIINFEKALTEYTGARHAVVCSNGTAALHLAYLAAGLKPGDEVIVPANTFVATTNMLLALGAKPIFCDIRLDTNNLDESKIEKLITSKTKAIVPVHFAGQPCELGTIKKMAAKHNLKIIEDASHALGAHYLKSRIGDCRYSDLAVFSFHPVKAIATGEGGAILTNNKKLAERMRLSRSHGIYKNKQGKNVMVEFGFNYRLTEIQAALGVSQLQKLNQMLKKRHELARLYAAGLKNLKEVILPRELSGNYSGWHLYVIRVADYYVRDRLAAYLKDHGIGVNFHYPAVYSHPYYREHGYRQTKLKNTEIYERSCLTLPLYTGLTKKEVSYICQQLKNFFKKT